MARCARVKRPCGKHEIFPGHPCDLSRASPVRGFATRDGERRAYLTWSGDPPPGRPITILDVDVVDGQLVVADTDVPLTPAGQG